MLPIVIILELFLITWTFFFVTNKLLIFYDLSIATGNKCGGLQFLFTFDRTSHTIIIFETSIFAYRMLAMWAPNCGEIDNILAYAA